MALIEAKNISVGQRVNSASLSLERGEIIGLLGPNGAGKSTFLNALAGLEKSTGLILIEGRDAAVVEPKMRARIVGLLPQSMQSAWSLSVMDVVALGRIPWGDTDDAAIAMALRYAEVEAFVDRKVDELSGGERARVWLARVLAGQPKVLLADEPVASLDIHYQLSVMNVLRAYAQENHGVIVAMHDLSLAARYCDRVCLMEGGEVVAFGGADEVLNESLLTSVYRVAVDVDLQRYPPVILPR